jgi:pimeloyl-ACP methyl ester carboxylesterase
MKVRHFCEAGMFVREVRPRNEGPVVLFVHGLGESGLCFEHLLHAPQLDGYRLLVPDLPGYGRSAWPAAGPMSLADQADLLAEWLGTKEAAPAVVVGHSMGGVVGLLMAERRPESVRLLVDVDGNKSPDDCVYSGQAGRYDLETFTAVGFDEMRARIHDRGIGDTAQRGYYVSLRLADPATFHRNSLELVEMSASLDLAARLAALPIPKVYVAGQPDGVSAVSRELLHASRVKVMEISPSGHWPFIDQPVDFLGVLAEILDWI